MIEVHRICSIALLIAMSVLLVVPELASNPSSRLPQCCRKHAKHHCAIAHEDGPAMMQRCPCVPLLSYSAGTNTAVPLNAARTIAGPLRTCFAAEAQTESLLYISANRSRQKRGPPSIIAS